MPRRRRLGGGVERPDGGRRDRSRLPRFAAIALMLLGGTSLVLPESGPPPTDEWRHFVRGSDGEIPCVDDAMEPDDSEAEANGNWFAHPAALCDEADWRSEVLFSHVYDSWYHIRSLDGRVTPSGSMRIETAAGSSFVTFPPAVGGVSRRVPAGGAYGDWRSITWGLLPNEFDPRHYELGRSFADCPPDDRLDAVVPGVVAATDVLGRRLRTRLVVSVPVRSETVAGCLETGEVTFELIDRLVPPGSVLTAHRPASPGSSLAFDDAVGELFGRDAFGPLVVSLGPRGRCSVAPIVSAQVWREESWGWGLASQLLQSPGIGPAVGSAIWRVEGLERLTGSSRTDVGVFPPSNIGASALRVSLDGPAGPRSRESLLALPPFPAVPVVSNFFESFFSQSVPAGIYDLSVADLWWCGEAIPWAESGTVGLFVPEVRWGMSPEIRASEEWDGYSTGHASAVGRGGGNFGSFWTTDLELENREPTPRTFRIAWEPEGTACPAGELLVRLGAEEVRLLPDLLATWCEAGRGRLSISPPDGELPFSARGRIRVSSRSPFGRSEQDFPVRGEPALLAPNEEAILPAIDPRADFRTNVGISTHGAAGPLLVRILGPEGEVFHERRIELPADGGVRLHDLFSKFPVPRDVPLSVSLRPLAPLGGVEAWSSVVENATQHGYTSAARKVDGSRAFGVAPVALSFVEVPRLSGRVGSLPDEPGRDDDEGPFWATLSRSFFLSTTEVSRRSWKLVMGTLPDGVPDTDLDRPVTRVSWNDLSGADGFLARLDQRLRQEGYSSIGAPRLPTEAEWELATRAFDDDRFWFADDGLCGDACEPCPPRENRMIWCGHPAAGDGPLPPPGAGGERTNPLGLADLSGNVWEWVADWYGPYPLVDGILPDPTGPETGELKVIRGGSFRSDARTARSANRFAYLPDSRHDDLGFRLVIPPRSALPATCPSP